MHKIENLSKEEIYSFAEEPLAKIVEIEEIATSEIQKTPTVSNVFAHANEKAYKNLINKNELNREKLRAVITEPIIARIKIQLHNEIKNYFIMKEVPSGGYKNHLSQNAPLGIIANWDIGDIDEVELGNSIYTVTLLEKEIFNVFKTDNKWDSINSYVINSFRSKGITIPSLRELCKEAGDDFLDFDFTLDEEETGPTPKKFSIFEGKKKNKLTKFSLPIQNILDSTQAKIFELPLKQNVLLLGPPGSGKTTTLIRRLGKKLDYEYLTEKDKIIIEDVRQHEIPLNYQRSWIMFTPKDLLKNYLKEAFNNNGIPTPDENLSTWSIKREVLALAFGIISKGQNYTSLILKEKNKTLKKTSSKALQSVFEEFLIHFTQKTKNFYSNLSLVFQHLDMFFIRNDNQATKPYQSKLEKDKEDDLSLRERINNLASELNSNTLHTLSLSEQILKFKSELSGIQKVRKKFTEQHRVILGSYLHKEEKRLQDNQLPNLLVIMRELFPTDEEMSYQKARSEYIKSIIALAKHKGERTKVSEKHQKVLERIKPTFTPEELEALSFDYSIQERLKKIDQIEKELLRSIVDEYLSFKEEKIIQGKIYETEISKKVVNGDEIDILLLLLLDICQEILIKSKFYQIDISSIAFLNKIKSHLCTQIFIDEVTDFSPIQLRCIKNLSHPQFKSLFMCGDLAQRLTEEGIASEVDFKWVMAESSLVIEKLETSYRQCRSTNEFANALSEISNIVATQMNVPINVVNNNGFYPILLENNNQENQLQWLAERIIDIYQFSVEDELPTIAILTTAENQLKPIEVALNRLLSDYNISVQASLEGQTTGDKSKVRIFCIEHIKGLEFEAVFLIELDELELEKPTLFDRYLYVAASRAATYLGITCKESLPQKLEPLRAFFRSTWKEYNTQNN